MGELNSRHDGQYVLVTMAQIGVGRPIKGIESIDACSNPKKKRPG